MIILAIDPGSLKTGFALIKSEQKKISYIYSGVLLFSQEKNFLIKIHLINQAISKLVQAYKPDHVALESLIYVKSPTALIKLAQARGAMLASLGESLLKNTFEYSPNLIKSTVTGHGHATKEGVSKVLSMTFPQVEFKTDDESDALAVAVCHAHLMGQMSKSSASVGGRSLSRSLEHKWKEKLV